MAHQVLKGAAGAEFAVGFAACGTLGFPSVQACAVAAGEGAASAGLVVDETSEVSSPLADVAAAGRRDAADTAIAVVLVPSTVWCSRFAVASGWLAVHKWVVHVDHAEGTGLMLANLTGVYDMISGESQFCSWLLRP